MTGGIRSAAGAPVPDFTRLALGLVLDSDAVVEDDGSVIGDPTEAALVVLAAKLGVDAAETRRAYPRLAEVPFDSDYKFMATFHRFTVEGVEHVIELVKGAPDVVIARCTQAGGPLSGSQVPMAQALAGIEAANVRMGEKGLRVLAFAARLVDPDELATVADDPMALTHDLAFVGMTGIIDPLRAEAKDAVTTALAAGIDVRMITGDHAVTAAGDRRGARARARGDQRRRAAGAQRRRAQGAAAPAARLRPGDPRGQAAPGPHDAGAGPDRRDDRRRGQRRRRPQAGRHRRRDGQRQRGDQAGGPDGAHRRQLRHARPRRRDRAPGLRQDRVVRALPDDPAALAGAALPRRDDLRRQPGRGDDPVDGAVPALLRHRRRRRRHRRRPRRPRRHAPPPA